MIVQPHPDFSKLNAAVILMTKFQKLEREGSLNPSTGIIVFIFFSVDIVNFRHTGGENEADCSGGHDKDCFGGFHISILIATMAQFGYPSSKLQIVVKSGFF